jgi:hypothetical protein
VRSARHRSNDVGENEEVLLLVAQEWLCLEEGNDLGHQIVPVATNEDKRRVRRSAMVLTDPATAEPLPDQVKDLTSFGILTHVKLWNELPPVPGPRIPLHRYVERSFSVD